MGIYGGTSHSVAAEIFLAVCLETGLPFLVLTLTSWEIQAQMAASQVEGGSWSLSM